MNSVHWYQDGLRFECTRCGHCCGGGPGLVHITAAEIAAAAGRLNLTEEEFRERYTRLYRKDIVILQEKPNFDCIFYDRQQGCLIYDQRPTQCRTFPFWNQNVRSPSAWAETAKDCPGMNHGTLHDEGSISRISQHDGTCSSAMATKTT